MPTSSRRHPETTITFSFNASSTLSAQIQQGVPADVFASADEANMDKLVEGGEVTATPTVFARNRLAIAVAPGNPENIKTLADTVDPDVTLVLCAPEVPCGKFAVEAYANAGVDAAGGPVRRQREGRALEGRDSAKPTRRSCTRPTSRPRRAPSKA